MPKDEKSSLSPSEQDANTTDVTPSVTIPQHLDEPPSSSSPIISSISNEAAADDGETNAMATTTSNDDDAAAAEQTSNPNNSVISSSNNPPLITSTGNNSNSSGGGGRIVILQSAGIRRQTRKKQRQRQTMPASVEEEEEQPAEEPTPGGANNNEDWANQVPGAWAIHGIDRPSALPQETPNDEMGRRRHRYRPDDTDAAGGDAGSSTSSSRIRSSARGSGTTPTAALTTAAGEESSSAGLVEATLVTEPQLVHAVPWDEVQRQQAQARADRQLAQRQQQQQQTSLDNNPPQDNNNNNDGDNDEEEVVNKIIRTALQEERQRNQRTCHFRIWIGLLLVFVIGAGVVGALFGLGVIDTSSSGSSSKSQSSSSSDSTSTSPPSSPVDADDSPADAPSSSSSSSSSSPAENESLTARCVQAPIEIPVSGSSEDCQSGVQVFASLVDRGSSSSVPLTSLRLVPPGPFTVGWHNVSLVAVDSVGRTDSCAATIVVMDELTEWTFFQNHAYRVRSCQLNWPEALEAVQASATTLCGSTAPAHLATITSEAERNVVRDLARGLNLGQEEFWLGGYQPGLADEPAGNWTWVHGEGLIFDGYTDWDPGEPNSASEDCMVMLGAKRGFRWDDRPCHRTRYRYIEEVDLPQQQNVLVNGCDSGVPDRLQDATTCAYLITPALQANCSSLKTNHDDEEDDNDDEYRACVQDFLMTLVEQGELSLLDQEKIVNCGSDNQPPIAVCQNVEVSVDPEAEVVTFVVNASMFDNGSSDPDGDWPLRLELLHQQPLLMVAGQSLDSVLGNHTVTLIVADGRGGQDSCQATLTITDGNQPPIAKCRNVLEMTGDSLCSGIKRIDGSQIDNGSADPEGAFVEFLDVIPAGPYDVGSNYTLTLTVKDNRGQLDACNTTLIVKSRVTWEVFENQHAYRAQVCNMEYWDTANQSAAAVSLCGARAHLATITSVQERDAVVDMVTGLMLLGGNSDLDELWLGGYQPEQAANPRDNWTWVNNEGQIFDGYTDWDSDEPNKKDEDCLAMDSDSGFRWNNKECSNQFRYIEEVDLERTVVIDGCDSGVPDVLMDVESCSYAIAEGISRCRLSVPALFSVCVDLYLDGLVVNGNITTNQKDAIAQCAGITTSSSSLSSSSTNSTARHLRG